MVVFLRKGDEVEVMSSVVGFFQGVFALNMTNKGNQLIKLEPL